MLQGFFFMGAGGADNSALQFSIAGLFCQGCHLPKKVSLNRYKIGGKVGVHSKISDFAVRNRNFIAKMTTIWS